MKSIPFCPNRECRQYYRKHTDQQWYYLWGTYTTKTFKTVHRYKCRTCGTTFSDQTFSLDYYVKQKVSYKHIDQAIRSTSSSSDIARDLGVSIDVIQNRTARLARQAVAVHSELITQLTLREDLTADGFESFCYSQYFPGHLNILVGKDSQLVYVNDYVTIRRKGAMTDAQKQKRMYLEAGWRADSKGLQYSFERIGERIIELFEGSPKPRLTLYTDLHPAYPKAWNRVPWFAEHLKNGTFSHVRISSNNNRTAHNPLFPVNYMDRELRKDVANFVRESAAFARNIDDLMNRVQIYLVYHNYRKVYRLKRKRVDRRVHGEVAGIQRAQIDASLSGYYTQRRFFHRCLLRPEEVKVWFRMCENPFKRGNKYIPGYAAA